MAHHIILIGPQRAGKSTLGKLLAQRLQVPFSDLGREAQRYFAEQGHDWDAAKRAWDEGGPAAFLRYQAPFEVYALERGLQDLPDAVVELGAFQVAVDDPALCERVRQALRPQRAVLHLLPSADADEAVRLLDERGLVLVDGVEINEHFVRHHSNHDLAKIRVYNKGQTPEETCEAIVQRLDPSSATVLLIGPIGTGKSTLGALLAARLGRPQVSLDTIRWDYYKEIGYDEAVQREIDGREGFAGVYRYWKRFEAYAVERALQDHRDCVMDFGAGHSVHENDDDFARVQACMAPYPNVVLILPSADLDESVAILRGRGTLLVDGVPFTRHLVAHPAFAEVATHTVLTQGQAPEETADAIARLLNEGEKGV